MSFVSSKPDPYPTPVDVVVYLISAIMNRVIKRFYYSNMQPCGTVFYWFQELLRLWMLAQRLAETDNEEFLNSVTKVAQIARSSEQLTMLAEAMQNQVL